MSDCQANIAVSSSGLHHRPNWPGLVHGAAPRVAVGQRALLAAFLVTILWALLSAEVGAASAVDSSTAAKKAARANEMKDLSLGPCKLDISANLRLRYEYQKGFDVRSYRPEAEDGLLLTRIMLDFNLRFTKQTSALLQVRDARAVDSRLGPSDFPLNNPIEDWCDIRQAFVEWSHIAGSPLGIKAGRQQISYGDQRVFGPGLWGNTGRFAWDAVILKADLTPFRFDLWAGRYVKNRPDRWPNRTFRDPTAFVVYGVVKGLPVALDVFHAIKYDGSGSVPGEKSFGNLRSYSSGMQTRGHITRQIDYTATFVCQLGKYSGDDIRAYGANAGVGVTALIPWETRLAAQYTWGSGDRDPYDGVHETFDGVFGGADINFYGDLNLFYWANLRDHELDFHVTPCDRIRILAEYHYFTLDQARDAWYTTGLKPLRRDYSGNAGTSLGHELDFRAVYSPAGTLEILLGYGHFSACSYVRNTGDEASVDGLFLQSTYAF